MSSLRPLPKTQGRRYQGSLIFRSISSRQYSPILESKSFGLVSRIQRSNEPNFRMHRQAFFDIRTQSLLCRISEYMYLLILFILFNRLVLAYIKQVLFLTETALDCVSDPLLMKKTDKGHFAVEGQSFENLFFDVLGSGQLLIIHGRKYLSSKFLGSRKPKDVSSQPEQLHQITFINIKYHLVHIVDMPTIKSNLLRLQINNPHNLYEVQIASKLSIQQTYKSQIDTYMEQSLPNSVFAYPFVYSVQKLTKLEYFLYLSNGNLVSLSLILRASNQDSKLIIEHITHKLMMKTQLLYSEQLDTCFNPFEEKGNDKIRQFPGFSLKALPCEQGCGIYFIPTVLQFDVSEDISESSKVLLDYYTGNFFLKQNIVRIDKNKGEVQFRNGTIIKRKGLHPITLKPINGYPLAYQLYHYIDRVKQQSKQFCVCWGIKFDSRLVQNSYNFIQPGHVSFRNSQQRSLAQIVTPISQHNYCYSYVKMYSSVVFEDSLQSELVLLLSQNQRQFMMQFAKHIDMAKYRMGLPIQTKIVIYKSLSDFQELTHIIHSEKTPNQKIYFLPHHTHKNKNQKELIDRVLQFFIDQNIFFQSMEVDFNNKQINFQAIALKYIAILYTKYRLNPWKIKNIPFSNNPMVVMSLHIQLTRQKLLSIALISTMNLYLNKFTAVHKICTIQQIQQVIEASIRQCIEKFKSAHGKYPIRIFLFRTGVDQQDLTQQHRKIKLSLFTQTGSTLTYVTLTKDHFLRTFNQIDNNYVSKDSVKKVQLLLYSEIKDELYIQLQLEEPMHRIKIYEIQKNDPNFVIKILQLLSKVIYGGVGNGYGRGLGFIDYSKKLNYYKDFNLQPWSVMLKQGILLFL